MYRMDSRSSMGAVLMAVWVVVALTGCGTEAGSQENSTPSAATSSEVGDTSQGLQGYSLSTNASSYPQGGTITVSWNAPAGHSATDWVGLYPVGAPDSSLPIEWKYVNGVNSGTLSFTAPSAGGSYDVRYLLDGGYTRAAVSSPFTVMDYSISTDASYYVQGGTITISWSAPAGHSAQDWVGLYPEGAPHAALPIHWEYVKGSNSGTLSFSAPSAGGRYNVRYFLANGYNAGAISSTFVVSDYSITTNASSYPQGSTITVSWSAPAGHSAQDWVGLYPAGAPSSSLPVEWKYVNGVNSGTLTFTAPSDAGNYDVRYLLNNGYTTAAIKQFAVSN